MARGRRSSRAKDNGATLGFEATLWVAEGAGQLRQAQRGRDQDPGGGGRMVCEPCRLHRERGAAADSAARRAGAAGET